MTKSVTNYLFFSGKGGVGKTTIACASAIHYAAEGKKTLIVSTDPASNLSDVFEQEIGHHIKPIEGILNLFAMEINPDEATKEYKERIIGPFREAMPEDVIASLEEQFNSPCTTEMASFDRFIDFMETGEYDIIVFDTAPTGHTIRLLELPVEWSKHIEESAKGSGQTCLGPVQAIQESKEKYNKATALLRDPKRTTFIFVMKPDKLSLYETKRTVLELESIGIKLGEVVINGVLSDEICDTDFLAEALEAQRKVIQETEKVVEKPKRFVLLRDGEVKGIKSLKEVADELFNGRRPSLKAIKPVSEQPDFALEKPDINRLFHPNGETKAVFFTGKGGVGKTTVSCVTALRLSQQGFNTLLVTTDPAAHIGEVLNKSIGSKPTPVTNKLFAVMIDQQAAFIEYKQRALSEARGKYSDDMLMAMEEELNSPCTEEMAAFDKFAQFMETGDYDVVVFDTAPTGHTLRLLDLPFDYAKQVEMMIAGGENAEQKKASQKRFRNIIRMLRDRNHTVFCIVLYPESTPILESYRAMLDLKEAGIGVQLVVANMVLSQDVCLNDFFKRRRHMQMGYLKDIGERFGAPVLTLPLVSGDIRGLKALRKLAELL
jgi:arsenite-transporting ATPase